MHLDLGWAPASRYIEKASEGMTNDVVSVGYLMAADEDIVVLAPTYDRDHDTYYGAQVIAREAVKEMERLS